MIFKIKDFAIVIMGQSPSSDILVDEYQANYLPFIGGGAEIGNLFPKSKRFCPDFITSKVKDGDIIISARAPVGKTNIADKEYILGRGACAVSLVSIPKELAWYFYEAIRIKLEMSCSGTGTTFDGISKADVENIEFDLPVNDDGSIDEASIAEMSIEFDNLDDSFRKTLRSLKQKLIHLDEYKTALIHNAVTKGLDANGCRIFDGTPAAEMKWHSADGLDYPIEWDVTFTKNALRFITGKCIPSEKLSHDEVGFRYLKTNDVNEKSSINKAKYWYDNKGNDGVYKRKDQYVISFQGFNSKPNEGTLGMVSNAGEGYIDDHLYLIDAGNIDFNSNFVEFAIQTEWMTNHVMKNITGAISYSSSKYKNFIPIPKPSLVEQAEISNYLKSKLSIIESQKQAINKKIALLNEYKKSLINEAVSGEMVVQERMIREKC